MCRTATYSPPQFQRRLKRLLAEQNINAIQLADRIGVERKTIYAWYNGTTAPDIYRFNKLCNIFGVSADWLLGRAD